MTNQTVKWIWANTVVEEPGSRFTVYAGPSGAFQSRKPIRRIPKGAPKNAFAFIKVGYLRICWTEQQEEQGKLKD